MGVRGSGKLQGSSQNQVVLDNIHRWSTVLKEADGATVEIVSNPGEDEIQTRFAPAIPTGDFPGFYLLNRTTREGARVYRQSLKALLSDLRRNDLPNKVWELEWGGENKIGVVLGEADLSDLHNAYGEAIRVSVTDALYIAGR